MSVERGRNNRGGSMSGSHTYVGKHPAQNERFGIYGVSEGKECTIDFSEVGKHEVCIPNSRILVQGILRRYRGEKHKGNKYPPAMLKWSIVSRQKKANYGKPCSILNWTGLLYWSL